jgi:uncharacterized membrane protein YphA (DoxX/SURF4 family)
LLTAPLRIAFVTDESGRIPLQRHGFQIGLAGVIALVLLRVTVGWHFLYQGVWKVQTPSFSASGFLSQAKGPLADHFYALVPDIDGTQHLDFETQLAAMKLYAAAFADQYKLDEAQQVAAKRALEIRQAALSDLLSEDGRTADGQKKRQLKEQYSEYLHKLDLLATDKEAAARDMPYARKRIWDDQQRLRGQAAGWTKEIDKIWDQLKADLDDVLGGKPDRPLDLRPETLAKLPEASAPNEREPLRAAPLPPSNLEQVDRLVTYSNMAIGVCLIAGLFTRFSALAGALFLAQIVAAQPDWPGMYPHPHPSAGRSLLVNKEFVEMMALVALAFLPTGRWAGLDHFVHNLVVRPLLGKKGSV